MPDTGCPHENTWFDRTLCFCVPTGVMHTVCEDCGSIEGGCDAKVEDVWCETPSDAEYPDVLHDDVPVLVEWWWTPAGRAAHLAEAKAEGARGVLAAVTNVVTDLSRQHDRNLANDAWVAGHAVANSLARAVETKP